MAVLAACVLLSVACGMHENGPAEQLVSGVVMPSGAEPYAPGSLRTTGSSSRSIGPEAPAPSRPRAMPRAFSGP